jgi:competence protein ComEA
MNREQQGVVLFLTLSLCLLFFLTGPFSSSKGGGKTLPMDEGLPPKSNRQAFPVEIDGSAGFRGIIPAEPGMTVGEVLARAGGVQEKLSLSPEDLGRRVEKGSRLSLQAEGEGRGKIAIEPLAPPKWKVLSVPIPLNPATAEELDILPGIGPKIAEAIIEFREKNGKFASPDDLLQVPGIGPKKLTALKPHITIE